MNKLFLPLLLFIILIPNFCFPEETSSKKFSFYIGSGLSMPLSPDYMRDSTKIGLEGTAHIGYSYFPNTEFMFSLDYHRLGAEIRGYDGGDWHILMIGPDAKLNLGLPDTKMYPYVFGGFGFAEVKRAERTFLNMTRPSVTVNKFYYQFGGGIIINMFYIETKFLKIMTDDGALTMVPLTVGVHF